MHQAEYTVVALKHFTAQTFPCAEIDMSKPYISSTNLDLSRKQLTEKQNILRREEAIFVNYKGFVIHTKTKDALRSVLQHINSEMLRKRLS